MSVPERADLLQVAKQAFRRLRIDFGLARRAGGRTNVTWIGGGAAVRVARSPGTVDLLREAKLAALLPKRVGYPRVIDSGVIDGYAWSATEFIEAVNADETWEQLTWPSRVRLWGQLWEMARAVHHLDVHSVAPFARERSPFYACNLDEARDGLRRLQLGGVLDGRQYRRLSESLDRHWVAMAHAPLVLNHGDLSPVNALWDGQNVVSLLDFEFAVIAPVHLDLNELVKHAFAPQAPEREACDGLIELQQLVSQLAEPYLRTQAGIDLLVGHSIQLETWTTLKELAKHRHSRPLEEWESYRMLASFAESRAGCFSALIEGHRRVRRMPG